MTKTNRTTPPISSAAANLLAQIEEALGLPAGTFLCPSTGNEDQNQILSDTLEIINVFARISDEQIRKRCVEFVRAAHEMTSPN